MTPRRVVRAGPLASGARRGQKSAVGNSRMVAHGFLRALERQQFIDDALLTDGERVSDCQRESFCTEKQTRQ